MRWLPPPAVRSLSAARLPGRSRSLGLARSRIAPSVAPSLSSTTRPSRQVSSATSASSVLGALVPSRRCFSTSAAKADPSEDPSFTLIKELRRLSAVDTSTGAASAQGQAKQLAVAFLRFARAEGAQNGVPVRVCREYILSLCRLGQFNFAVEVQRQALAMQSSQHQQHRSSGVTVASGSDLESLIAHLLEQPSPLPACREALSGITIVPPPHAHAQAVRLAVSGADGNSAGNRAAATAFHAASIVFPLTIALVEGITASAAVPLDGSGSWLVREATAAARAVLAPTSQQVQAQHAASPAIQKQRQQLVAALLRLYTRLGLPDSNSTSAAELGFRQAPLPKAHRGATTSNSSACSSSLHLDLFSAKGLAKEDPTAPLSLAPAAPSLKHQQQQLSEHAGRLTDAVMLARGRASLRHFAQAAMSGPSSSSSLARGKKGKRASSFGVSGSSSRFDRDGRGEDAYADSLMRRGSSEVGTSSSSSIRFVRMRGAVRAGDGIGGSEDSTAAVTAADRLRLEPIAPAAFLWQRRGGLWSRRVANPLLLALERPSSIARYSPANTRKWLPRQGTATSSSSFGKGSQTRSFSTSAASRAAVEEEAAAAAASAPASIRDQSQALRELLSALGATSSTAAPASTLATAAGESTTSSQQGLLQSVVSPHLSHSPAAVLAGSKGTRYPASAPLRVDPLEAVKRLQLALPAATADASSSSSSSAVQVSALPRGYHPSVDTALSAYPTSNAGGSTLLYSSEEPSAPAPKDEVFRSSAASASSSALAIGSALWREATGRLIYWDGVASPASSAAAASAVNGSALASLFSLASNKEDLLAFARMAVSDHVCLTKGPALVVGVQQAARFGDVLLAQWLLQQATAQLNDWVRRRATQGQSRARLAQSQQTQGQAQSQAAASTGVNAAAQETEQQAAEQAKAASGHLYPSIRVYLPLPPAQDASTAGSIKLSPSYLSRVAALRDGYDALIRALALPAAPAPSARVLATNGSPEADELKGAEEEAAAAAAGPAAANVQCLAVAKARRHAFSKLEAFVASSSASSASAEAASAGGSRLDSKSAETLRQAIACHGSTVGAILRASSSLGFAEDTLKTLRANGLLPTVSSADTTTPPAQQLRALNESLKGVDLSKASSSSAADDKAPANDRITLTPGGPSFALLASAIEALARTGQRDSLHSLVMEQVIKPFLEPKKAATRFPSSALAKTIIRAYAIVGEPAAAVEVARLLLSLGAQGLNKPAVFLTIIDNSASLAAASSEEATSPALAAGRARDEVTQAVFPCLQLMLEAGCFASAGEDGETTSAAVIHSLRLLAARVAALSNEATLLSSSPASSGHNSSGPKPPSSALYDALKGAVEAPQLAAIAAAAENEAKRLSKRLKAASAGADPSAAALAVQDARDKAAATSAAASASAKSASLALRELEELASRYSVFGKGALKDRVKAVLRGRLFGNEAEGSVDTASSAASAGALVQVSAPAASSSDKGAYRAPSSDGSSSHDPLSAALSTLPVFEAQSAAQELVTALANVIAQTLEASAREREDAKAALASAGASTAGGNGQETPLPPPRRGKGVMDEGGDGDSSTRWLESAQEMFLLAVKEWPVLEGYQRSSPEEALVLAAATPAARVKALLSATGNSYGSGVVVSDASAKASPALPADYRRRRAAAIAEAYRNRSTNTADADAASIVQRARELLRDEIIGTPRSLPLHFTPPHIKHRPLAAAASAAAMASGEGIDEAAVARAVPPFAHLLEASAGLSFDQYMAAVRALPKHTADKEGIVTPKGTHLQFLPSNAFGGYKFFGGHLSRDEDGTGVWGHKPVFGLARAGKRPDSGSKAESQAGSLAGGKVVPSAAEAADSSFLPLLGTLLSAIKPGAADHSAAASHTFGGDDGGDGHASDAEEDNDDGDHQEHQRESKAAFKRRIASLQRRLYALMVLGEEGADAVAEAEGSSKASASAAAAASPAESKAGSSSSSSSSSSSVDWAAIHRLVEETAARSRAAHGNDSKLR